MIAIIEILGEFFVEIIFEVLIIEGFNLVKRGYKVLKEKFVGR